MAPTSEPASGSEEQNAPSFGIAGGAEHVGQEPADLFGSPVARQRRRREPGAHDRQRDAGVTPEHLLERGQHAQPARFGRLLREEVGGVEADLGGLLDHRPRSFLAFVPFGGGRSDDLGRELVHPIADFDHVVAELH